ncbi:MULTISPECIES: alpha/beta hydrolase [unclassified Phenylobacterium]|uniref:alpha/beta hydrolase n=1 Tax=unclassified Phenylobacterium TaxID=2640670 RepID=UPI00083B851C|nr:MULTISPECIES: alpha/beta hydrolase [unclassified Phenylobacterium]
MDRRSFVLGVSAAASAGAAHAAAPLRARNVVLVHGAYADGSCWSEVIPRLLDAGLKVTAVQNPLRTLAEDCDYTRRILALQDGPTVLVAHSYGGEVITETGLDPKVSALVYCAARAPDAGEDYTALAKTYPAAPASAGVVFASGYGAFADPVAFMRDFANGVEPAKARVLFAVQGRISDQLFQARVTQAAWRTKPSFYQVSKLDRTINPDLQRFMAGRMKAKTIELDAGHLAIVSHARQVAELILDAARV